MLRTWARFAAIAGALGSVGLTVYTGRDSAAPVAVALVAGWVLSPFVLFLLGDLLARRWHRVARSTLHGATALASLLSLAIYGLRALSTPHSGGAFVFVILPPVTVVLVAASVVLAGLLARGATHGGSAT